MSLDVSLKHSEYMFRHEILKVIIIEGGSPILAHLSQCVRCIINSYFKGHLLNYCMDGMGVYQTWQKWSLYGPLQFFFQIVSVHCISKSHRLKFILKMKTFEIFLSETTEPRALIFGTCM